MRRDGGGVLETEDIWRLKRAMLTRIAILRLHAEGHGSRTVAKALGVSRNAVREVIRNGQAEVPALAREEKAAPHLERIRSLYVECKGNLVRVQEKLADEDVHLAYSTLTAFLGQPIDDIILDNIGPVLPTS
jgi:hypothetical protein